MGMNTTINIRMDKKVKTDASKALAKMGLDMSTAIKLFLHQVVMEQGMPFTPTSNPAAIRARWDAQVAAALKSPSYPTAQDALRDL